MSKHFLFDERAEALNYKPAKANRVAKNWRPSLPNLPCSLYDPHRYQKLNEYFSNSPLAFNQAERREIASLLQDYEQVLRQYQESVYNTYWIDDHPLTVKIRKNAIVRFANEIPRKIQKLMLRSKILFWVKSSPSDHVTTAKDLDKACIQFYVNIQLKNSKILDEVVERTAPWVICLLSVSAFIYSLKTGLLLDSLGLDIVNGVLVVK